MKNIIICFFSILLFTDCKKNTPETPVVVVPVGVTPGPDPAEFAAPFTGVPSVQNMALYEVNMRAFSSEGTFKGVQARLDSIKALGINVLWLMPIHPIGILNNAGQLGSPYSVRNFKEVNTEYGTLEDLQTLVKEAHNRNMSVILDWVANHTAWDNPWITDHADFYSKDASGKIIIPAGTNWADVADLDYSNATMRLFMISAMKYWVLKANIDGFRCDYADGVPSDFWKEAITALKALPNRKIIMLAEGNSAWQSSVGFDMNFSWAFYDQLVSNFKNKSVNSNLFKINSNDYSVVQTGFEKLRFTTNHDKSAWDNTPFYLFGGQQGALGAFVLASYMSGVPLIYNGQEVGRADKTPFFSKSPINWSLNPDVLAEYKRLMTFRQSSNAVKAGTLENLNDANIVAFRRVFQSEEVLVFVNIQGTNSTFSVPTSLANSNWKNALDNSAFNVSNSIVLTPYQYLILKK